MGNDELLNHIPVINKNLSEETKGLDSKKTSLDFMSLISTSTNLIELIEIIIKYNAFNNLGFTSNYNLYDGNKDSNLMVIGDFPSRDDLKIGLPFKGSVGNLLDAMLKAIGFNRNNTFYTNLFYNEVSNVDHLSFYLSILHKQIELVNPKVIILLGADVAKIVLEKDDSIFTMRGEWFTINSNFSKTNFSVIPIFHPRHLMMKPDNKKEAWTDLKAVRKKIS